MEYISLNDLQKGPITKTASDSKSGRGLMGTEPNVSGRLNCSFVVTAVMYLKRADEGGYKPVAPGEGTGEEGYVPQGPGKGGPGVINAPDKTTPGAVAGETPAAKSGGGGFAREDIALRVRAKAVRMLDRALRESGINFEASNFTGRDYQALPQDMKTGLVARFINAGYSEEVTIARGQLFYCGKLADSYARHPELENELFVDTLTTFIVMVYDWSEPGIDKEELARQYLGERVYQANKNSRL